MDRLHWLLWIFLLPITTIYAQSDLYDPDHITEIKIFFAEDNWAEILEKYKEDPEEPRLTADMEVDGRRYRAVGVRYKGNSSFNAVHRKGHQKLPFNIKIDDLIDDQVLPGGYDKLKLSNGFRDPSFLREIIAYEIAGQYMPASRANFARVYVNDAYLGVYTSVESVDKQFLERRFGEGDGVLVKCDPIWNYEHPASCPEGDKASLQYLGADSACYAGLYELKSDTGWGELIEFTRILNESPEDLESYLDVDQALWLLAFSNVIVNLDSYLGAFCHNYYLYQDKEGVFHPIIWDLNLAFGGFRLSGLASNSTLSDADMQEMSMFIHYKQQNNKRPLVTQLLTNDLYRKMYVAHCKTILEEHFLHGQYLERAKELQDLVQEAIWQDSSKLYSDSAFVHNLEHTEDADGTPIIGLAELMEKRAQYLGAHKLISDPAPGIGPVSNVARGDSVLLEVALTGAEAGWVFYRDMEGRRFRKIPMEAADSEEHDQKIYRARLPNAADLQYFLVAEGPINARVHPARAGREYLTLDAQ